MDTHTQKFKIRLGIFIAGGIALFIIGIFIIGKQKNMFNPVFAIHANFHNINGLQVGNTVRFSGINVGTVDNITIINDSTVTVEMIIQKQLNQFIKTNSSVSIGSEGIIGDKYVIISQGGAHNAVAKNGQQLSAIEPVDTDAILASLVITVNNAEIITQELAGIMYQINNGNGTLGRLIQDSTIAENINKTIVNLKKSSKGLNDNMEAAKHTIFLRGYYKDKK